MKTDVVIVGGGPGGSAAAMYLAQYGIKPLIVERETFPRFHIGESMTGEAGRVLRELGFNEPMLAARYPIKHGVKVYGNAKGYWFVPVMDRTPSGLVDVTTWQVRRSTFDKMLLDEAVARGATLLPGRAMRPLLANDGVVRGVQVAPHDGGRVDVQAEIVLDCTGLATFMATHRVTGPKYLGAYDRQIAIFSHVTGFVRDQGSDRDQMPGNAMIFYKKKYHWAWAIPVDDEVTSVGVVVPAQYFLDCHETKPAFLARELAELSPELTRRLPEIKFVEDVHVIPNYSFQVQRFAGPGFLCVGDSHRFIDPIFSFGLYFSLKEAALAAAVTHGWLAGQRPAKGGNPFAGYMVDCERAIDAVEDAIDAFWENPAIFALCVHYRHREPLIDLFAGRVYGDQPAAAVNAFRKLLGRERVYDPECSYSVPIGSRYHPERAAIWNADASAVTTTEEWTRGGGGG